MLSPRGLSRAVRPLAVIAALLLGTIALASPAQAAAPSRSITPFVNCYWYNSNGTVTASVGYRSSNSGVVTEPIGTNNRFRPGAQNRGQPTTFLPGTHNNVFAVTVTFDEIEDEINWYVSGNRVNMESLDECATKPVPQVGSVAALLLGFLLIGLSSVVVLVIRERRASSAAIVP